MSTRQRRRIALPLALALFAAGVGGCATTPAASLAVGDCFDSADLAAGDEVTRVQTVSCDDPHDTEVVGAFVVNQEDYPGADRLDELATERCPEQFRSYVGADYSDSALTVVPLIPSQEGWAAGDRAIICLATAPEPQTESIRGAQR